jgi:hypothetical protein
MNKKALERQYEFSIYKKNNKVINERVTKIVYDDIQDIHNALQEIRRNIEMITQQKNDIEKALENYRKEEKSILNYLECQIE